MEKIIITATAESIEQVEQLLEAGVDRIYVMNDGHLVEKIHA